MGTTVLIAAYAVYAAFWLRFFQHALLWWRGRAEDRVAVLPRRPSPVLTLLGWARDVSLFWRLLKANPALWFGEYLFHVTLLLVLLRHLRFFLDPVPQWVWDLQLPGLIAGYLLPLSLLYILAVRAFSERETYSAPANLLLLALLLAASAAGLLMREVFRADLVAVKASVLGFLSFAPAPLPDGGLFLLHIVPVLAVVALLPSHVVTAPLVMLEARQRDLGLRKVLHDAGDVR